MRESGRWKAMASARARLATLGLTGAISLVAGFEALRLHTYLDPVGIPTTCFGHTGPGVKLGQWRSIEECEGLLVDDLLIAYEAVKRCIRAPIGPNERIAYTSFVYNVGGGAFCNSTLVKLRNSGNKQAACDQLPRWKYSKGIEWPGLVKRRAIERDICLKPDQ